MYPTGLDVSTRHLDLLTTALSAQHRATRTPWRALSPRAQALLVLAYLRKNETCQARVHGFRIGVATVFRYVREGLLVLARQAPDLPTAMRDAAAKAYLVLDGTVIATDRVLMTKRGADKEFYSGRSTITG